MRHEGSILEGLTEARREPPDDRKSLDLAARTIRREVEKKFGKKSKDVTLDSDEEMIIVDVPVVGKDWTAKQDKAVEKFLKSLEKKIERITNTFRGLRKFRGQWIFDLDADLIGQRRPD